MDIHNGAVEKETGCRFLIGAFTASPQLIPFGVMRTWHSWAGSGADQFLAFVAVYDKSRLRHAKDKNSLLPAKPVEPKVLGYGI